MGAPKTKAGTQPPAARPPAAQRRVKAANVARMTGHSTRWVTNKAAAGEIPSAFQFSDGGGWCFEEAMVRRWLKRMQRRPAFTDVGAAPNGDAYRSVDAIAGDHLRRLLRLLSDGG